MSLQLRRGTDSDRLSIIPASGEPLFTTDTKKFYIGDGVTPGGLLLADANAADSNGQSVFATIEYVDNIVDSIIGAAPNSLNTLQELAQAINNDSDVYGSLVNLIDNQLDSAEVSNFVDSAFVQSRFRTLSESDGKLIVSGHILPDADSVYSIGRPDRKFKDLYLSGGTIYIDALALEADPITNTISISRLDGDQLTKLGVIATIDSSKVGEIVDSAFVQKRVNEEYLSGIIDSDYVLDRSSNYIQAQIDALIDAAPDALDTLNELAAAINDDSNFAGTITSSIATKLAINDFTSFFDSAFSLKTTSDLLEGTGQYYTRARFDSAFNERITTIDRSIVPDSDIVYNLGSPQKRFKDVYLSGNTIVLGSISISDAGEGGLAVAQVDSNGEVTETAGTISSKNIDNVFDIDLDSTGQQTIDAFSINKYRTARYIIQMVKDSDQKYHSTEILLMHNNTDVFMTEYAILKTQDSDIGSITADINDSSVRLLITPNFENINIKAKRLIIDV